MSSAGASLRGGTSSSYLGWRGWRSPPQFGCRVTADTHRSKASEQTRFLRSCSPASCPRHKSEEHTSELQSQSNLVCRLLLEKKNTVPHRITDSYRPLQTSRNVRNRSLLKDPFDGISRGLHAATIDV